LFVGVPGTTDPEYRGTAFVVGVPGKHGNLFAFTVTARHVAEKLEGNEFVIRANRREGGVQVMHGHADNPWWYHPQERDYVDAAVTLFSPLMLPELDVEYVPISVFADEKIIAEHNLGVGDEVFITGLFTMVTETTKNIPIVRTGTVAMIPGEKIPFGATLIEAYLIESRSIGGLSGSPVFIRETLKMNAGIRMRSGIEINQVNDKIPGQAFEVMEMQGTGRFYFLGSIVGHWDSPAGFSPTQAEAVNMGISLVAPAHKIREIILQPSIMEMMSKADEDIESQGIKLTDVKADRK